MAGISVKDPPSDEIVEVVAVPDSGLPDHTEFLTKAGDWTPQGARRFLSACPRRMVYVPPDNEEEARNPEKAQPLTVIWNGVWWLLPKGKQLNLPTPIAEIIEQRLEPFRTTQAQERKTYIVDIGDTMGPEIPLEK